MVQNESITTPAVKLEDTTFIPAGGVYYIENGEYKYVAKNTDGSFHVPANATVQTFNVPENKITTFGASNDLNNNEALRFGNYSRLAGNGVTHGTLVFEGAWLELKNHYIKKGYTVEQFVEAIYKNAVETLKKPANEEKTFVSYTLGKETINVYIFKQKNYMWKDAEKGILEYTLRLNGTKAGNTYAAVAFAENGDKVTFSQDVKSVTVPQLQEN